VSTDSLTSQRPGTAVARLRIGHIERAAGNTARPAVVVVVVVVVVAGSPNQQKVLRTRPDHTLAAHTRAQKYFALVLRTATLGLLLAAAAAHIPLRQELSIVELVYHHNLKY
jgi:hypothetical protein